jgi:aminoglycoside 6'-N-acetyltransferase
VSGDLSFRPLERGDLPLVDRWLHAEHVRRWWPPYPDLEAEYGPVLSGDEPTRVDLVLEDGRPVGLIQTYLVADHPEWEALVQVGPGVAGVDLLLGDPAAVGRGLGPAALAAYAARVVFASPGTTACVAGVDIENHRSLRAFAKAGFVPVRDYVEEGRPHRLVRLERPG